MQRRGSASRPSKPPTPSRQRQPNGQAPLRLQLLAIGAVIVFVVATAAIYTIASSSNRFSVADWVAKQPLRAGVPPPPLAPPPMPPRQQQPPPPAKDGAQQAPSPPPPPRPSRPVWWFAPFLSGSGMGQEALLLVLGLQRYTEYGPSQVWISSHGDLDRYEVFSGLARSTQRELEGMVRRGMAATFEDAAAAVIVCHSEPGAWALPQPLYQTSLCPPVPLRQAAYVVARAMFETDRVSAHHVARCNQMWEVWVPTEFHRATFAASGVEPDKLRVVPEPVDSEEFDPGRHPPMPLPRGQRVFGPAWPHAAASGAGAHGSSRSGGEPFVFLSIFKWEARKGWDVLLRAYLTAFTAADNVLLLLHTKPFHGEADFGEQMQAWARRELGKAAADASGLPSLYVLSDHIAQRRFPQMYKAADCFVLPTRGEGWGLPIVEAMAMGLPVIATNWSGPTAYLDDGVGYPLRSEGLEAVEKSGAGGAFAGHQWASPSVQHLAQLMRHVVAHRQEAAARGRAARRRMQERYSPAAVAQLVAAELRRIDRQLAR